MENIIDVINNAAEYIADSIKFTPEIAIILGSGLGPLADEVQSPVVINTAIFRDFTPQRLRDMPENLYAV